MNIDVAYGRDIDDGMLEQLLYMEADAYAYYESLNVDEDEHVICALPSMTLKQFKKKSADVLFIIKVRKTKSGKTLLIGMACLSNVGRKKDLLCLHSVYVKPMHRAKGIGEALVRKAISIAKKMHMPLSLSVNPLNKVAVHLYKVLGFKPCKGQSLKMELR